MAHEKAKKLEGKKSRDDKEHVMEMLFALFEKHQYYKINDLVKATKQPVPYLKQILNEICDYNMKNPHRNMWELKAEYRHYKKTDEDRGKYLSQKSKTFPCTCVKFLKPFPKQTSKLNGFSPVRIKWSCTICSIHKCFMLLAYCCRDFFIDCNSLLTQSLLKI